ncbi:MAG: hypothetical protein D8M59_09850 [Planctomycetes bacterium]|nr:hypothetical protein [Planctomycetota bacterium]NOG53439.1 DUF4097 family beta strand repeat protein [Planctomycetota bacterium]
MNNLLKLHTAACRRQTGIMWLILAAAPFVLAAAGCGGVERQEMIFDRYPPTEALAVYVDNFRGDVQVEADPTVTGPVVKARLHARHEWFRVKMNTFGAAKLDRTLDEVNVQADLDHGTGDQQGLAILRVMATTAFDVDRDPDLQWVDLHITAPSVDGVDIRTQDGSVDLVGISGAVTVANHNGNVVVRTTQPLVDPVTITTSDGHIYYRVTGESAGAFDIETIGGKAHIKAVEGTLSVQQEGQSRILAQFNDGGNPIVLRTTHDQIRVAVTPDPMPLGIFGMW